MVEAYVGPAGTLTIHPPERGDPGDFDQNAAVDGHGYSVSGRGVLAIGVSLGTATIDGTPKRHERQKLLVGHSLTVEATNTGKAAATIFALAGGIGA